MTTSGSSAETVRTKSTSPFSAMLSMMVLHAARTFGSIAATMRGVKPLDARRRNLLCCGGSMFNIRSWITDRLSGG